MRLIFERHYRRKILRNSSDNPLNCYVSSHWKSLRDGLDTSNHYILLRSAQ